MPWDANDIKRLIELEAHQRGIDPRLALALAEQENPRFDPAARSPKGAIGIMQLMPKTALGLKVDPYDVPQNISGGLDYLKQQLDAFGGDTKMALAAYNAGPGVVKAYGKVPPYKETQGYVSRILAKLGPASAEAATPQAQPQAAGMSRLQELEAHLARLEGRAATQASPAATPQPPTATSTPEQDAAYRASRGQHEPTTAPRTAPAPTTSHGASQGPSGTRLSLGDPTEAASETEAQATIARMRASAAGAPGLAPPPADRSSLAVGGGPSQQAQPVTDPAALLAGGTRQAPGQSTPAPAPAPAEAPMTMQGQIQDIAPLQPRGAEAVQGRVHESGTPVSALPAIAINTVGTMGGAALGALTSPVTGPIGPAAGAALGGALATRANTALGLAPQETPILETPWANVYPSDVLGSIPLGIATGAAALKGAVRNLPGANVGRHELAAEKLTALGTRVGPAEPSSALFAEAAAKGGNVPTVNMWREAGKIVREEKAMKKGYVSTDAMQAGSGLMELMRDHAGQVPIAEVEKYRQRLFQKIRTTTDKAELQRLQDLYGAIHDDLALAATAGTTAGAPALKAAIAAKRKEHAQETLTDIWSPGKGLQLQEGEHVQVYGKRIRNEVERRLHQDKLFAGSFTPAEIVDMRNTLREVGKLTRITNPDAQGTVGSSLKWLGRLSGGLYGASTGSLEGLLTGGAMILATEGATATLRNIMLSKVGRWGLREAIREGNGQLTHGSLAAIAALVAREAAPEAPAPAPAPTP